MKSYIPSPTPEQWDNFHRQLFAHPTPPSLHRPTMWEEFRQALYEENLKIERYARGIRFHFAHRAFLAKMKAQREAGL